MQFIFEAGEVLLVLALIGLIGVIVLLVTTALRFKTAVVGHGKRLAERPTNSVKTLIATGKGIAQQETVRAKRIAAVVKQTGSVVGEVAKEVSAAAKTVHPSDLKDSLHEVQATWKQVAVVAELLQAVRGAQAQQTPRS